MKRRASILGFIISLILVMFPSHLNAAYDEYLSITVSSNNASAFSYIPILVSLNNSQLSSYGYIAANGLNTNLLEGATAKDFGVYSNKTLIVIPSLAAGQTRTYQYQLGYTPAQTVFPFSTGYNGYITTADDASLEPGDDFEFEVSGYIDTSVAGNIISKTSAFELSSDGAGNVTAEIQEPLFIAPTVIDKGTANAQGNAFAPSYPASINAGDILFLFVVATGTDVTFPNPPGWTLISASGGDFFNDSSPTRNGTGGLWYRVATGSESGAIAAQIVLGTSTIVLSQIYQVSGANVSTPIYSSAVNKTGNGSTTVTFPASSITGTGNTVLAFVGQTDDAPGVGNIAGYTQTTSIDVTTVGTDAQVMLQEKEDTTTAGSVTAANGETTGWITYQVVMPAVESTTVLATVTASGVSSSEQVVKVTADTTDLKIYIDGVEEDSVALTGASVPDNANNWVLIGGNTAPYVDYFKHTVGGVLKAWYQPNTMIIPSSLTDRSGNGNTGVMTLVGNHPSITVIIGGIVASSTYTASSGDSEEGGEVIYTPGMVVVENTSATGSNLPYYTIVNRAASTMGISTLSLYGLMVLFIALVVFVAVSISTSSQMMGLIGAGMTTGIGAAAIIGIWVVFLVAVGGGMLLYVYRRT